MTKVALQAVTPIHKAMETKILAIESSCDDTSAAVLNEARVLSNLVANQKIHEQFGGVVPELASREHQKNILPVVQQSLEKAGVELSEIDAIAYTRGPGLLGSLLVGGSFAKGLSIALNKPLLEVHHMQAHILAHWIEDGSDNPEFPFLNLTVSGGHTQIVRVNSPTEFVELGSTLDDAAGEAFDKVAKIMGLPYPGGPVVDRLAKEGDPNAFSFTKSKVPKFNFSFSGLKTGVLNFLKKELRKHPDFIEKRKADICASVQRHIVSYLLDIFEEAAKKEGIQHLGIAGGVSANSELRASFEQMCERNSWKAFVPKFEYCTDNAAMIGIAGHFLLKENRLSGLESIPKARFEI